MEQNDIILISKFLREKKKSQFPTIIDSFVGNMDFRAELEKPKISNCIKFNEDSNKDTMQVQLRWPYLNGKEDNFLKEK